MKNEENVLRRIFHVNPDDYPLLSEQYAGGYTLGADLSAESHLRCTAALIANLDGSDEEYEYSSKKPPEHVIYLDKSARPVRWLVDTFWEELAVKDDSGNPVPKPTQSHLLIDRLFWFTRTGTKHDLTGNGQLKDGSWGRLTFNDFDQERVTKEDLAGIHALYVEGGVSTDDPDEILAMPTILDNKRVLIIDEVKSSGASINIAKFLIKAAIPAIVGEPEGGYYWDDTGTKLINGEMQMGSAPVWYSASDLTGRGIGEIDEEYYRELYRREPTDKNRALMLGAFAIGRPLEEDEKGDELKKEIGCMLRDYRNMNILFSPPFCYSDKRTEEALTRQGFKCDDSGMFSSYALLRKERNILKTKNAHVEYRALCWTTISEDINIIRRNAMKKEVPFDIKCDNGFAFHVKEITGSGTLLSGIGHFDGYADAEFKITMGSCSAVLMAKIYNGR